MGWRTWDRSDQPSAGERLHRPLAAILAARLARRPLLTAAALGLADALGVPRATAACAGAGQPCRTDADCCHNVCDSGVCWQFVAPCTLPDGSNGRALGAPCDRDDQCCGGAVCRGNARSDLTHLNTCQPSGDAWQCPDGRPPCPSRMYSAMGPYQCCYWGDTCAGDDRGCLGLNCSINNEACQDVWGNATCDGRWGFCSLVTDGSVQCIDFTSFATCPSWSQCSTASDCGSGEACVVAPPGCCQNPSGTLRYCAPLVGYTG
jgi:hypothetical protein